MDDTTTSPLGQPATAAPLEAAPPAWRNAMPWIIFGLLLTAQFGLFYQFAQREVVWSYPTRHDQNNYISLSYVTYEDILSRGLWDGIKAGLKQPVANGMLLHVEAGVAYLLLGPSRMSALSLNFAHFALFQLALFGTLRWLTGRSTIAFLGLGLLLAAKAPFLDAGGIMDFRIDFTAFCLFGIFLCTVVRSRMFTSWQWSLLVGCVASSVALFRFLTMPYLACIFTLFFLHLTFQVWWNRRDVAARTAALRQLGGIVLAGIILSAVVFPVVLYKWRWISNYYITHLQNGENEIRAAEFGYVGALTRLFYYPISLVRYHAGPAFLAVAGVCLFAAAAVGMRRFFTKERSAGQILTPSVGSIFFACLCVVIPLAVLTSYSSPSPVVASIGVGALLWLIVLVSLRWVRLPSAEREGALARCVIGALALGAVLIGVHNQTRALCTRSEFSIHRAEYEKLLDMYERIGQYSQDSEWREPTLSINVIAERFHAGHVRTTYYERRGVLLKPSQKLAMGIGSVPEDKALAMVAASDFVILCKNADYAPPMYPFNQVMPAMYPNLRAAAERTHVPFHHFDHFETDVMVYVRPSPRVKGLTADRWITSQGLTLTASAEHLRDFPVIKINGAANWKALGKTPTVRAQLLVPGASPREAKAAFTPVGKTYELVVKVNREDVPQAQQVDIHVSFDHYFVPSEMGTSPDDRQLVVRSPETVFMYRE